ncbi:MAG: hypothetical protein WDA06_03035 [Phenylobacterium sp.]
MTMPKVEIKGWDWTELVPALLGKSYGYYYKKYNSEDNPETKIIEDLRKVLNDMAWEIAESEASLYPEKRAKSLKKTEKKLKFVREFVAAVMDAEGKDGAGYNLLKGLRDTKHDWTFLKYTSILLDTLWT